MNSLLLRMYMLVFLLHSSFGLKKQGKILFDLPWYSSSDIIRNLKPRRWLRSAGHVTRMEQSRNAHGILVWKPEGKRPLGRPRLRWENNIKMDLKKGLCLWWTPLKIETESGLILSYFYDKNWCNAHGPKRRKMWSGLDGLMVILIQEFEQTEWFKETIL